ncbi:MAG: hypothetical protein F4Z01_01015 [Gammaproteobacteria bacterium]|nr:hypothetical protein [Gammaproteobacteria bacterium]MYF38890.1 hypothetical protein [Gammaproteobacteria bacterium]
MNKLNCKNRTLFHGDNLKFLRALNSESVDLIATDPPFKKGKDFHATPDSLASGAKFQDRWRWDDDVQPEWLDQIRDDFPEIWLVIDTANSIHMRKTRKNLSQPREQVGSDMGAFLCFMAVRLLEMHRLLKPTGSIYLHCDPTASHYLKLILDAIFGKKNFQNEIVWAYRTGGASDKQFAKKHDILLAYKKSSQYVHRPLVERLYYEQEFFTTNKKDEEGRIYEDVYMRDVWTDIKALLNLNKERVGYPTQKPLALYGRILDASSVENDVVLDPFAGCATTLVVAEQLKRQWVGIDLWENVENVVKERLEKESEKLYGTLFAEEIHFTDQVPERTDDQQTAAPELKVKESVRTPEPPGARMTRAEMYEHLIIKQGSQCQGCDREFDDQRYLELDHNVPRRDGGINHISNRILLCSPCNRLKGAIYTLSGLRRENKKQGYMK